MSQLSKIVSTSKNGMLNQQTLRFYRQSLDAGDRDT